MRCCLNGTQRKLLTTFESIAVTFEEAATCFGDPFGITIEDKEHSEEEQRFALLAESIRRRLLVVIHTDRGDTIRIISPRQATQRERRIDEEGQ